MSGQGAPQRRWLRRSLTAFAGALGLLLMLFGSAHLLTDRFAWARAVAWLESDTGDQFRFPSRQIAASEEPSALGKALVESDAVSEAASKVVGQPLEEFLGATHTQAFLVVHHDEVVYEEYLGQTSPEDLQTSFSAAKSFVSTLIGIAIDEGVIDSVTDPVTTYIPELAERDVRFTEITLRDLLTMSSGIHYEEQGLPWSDDALTYYGTDLRELALTHTTIDEEPGKTWRYNNYHPLLLGIVLERAAGMSVSEYMSSRLWQPLGAEADASWSLDSTDSGLEKLESGINARPRDFARFGLMMLHDGRWNGRQIVSEEWVEEATAASTEHDPAPFYQYLWWVADDQDGPRRAFFAQGKYGQLVGVFPEEDMVIVRLGSETGDVDWQETLSAIAEAVDSGH